MDGRRSELHLQLSLLRQFFTLTLCRHSPCDADTAVPLQILTPLLVDRLYCSSPPPSVLAIVTLDCIVTSAGDQGSGCSRCLGKPVPRTVWRPLSPQTHALAHAHRLPVFARWNGLAGAAAAASRHRLLPHVALPDLLLPACVDRWIHSRLITLFTHTYTQPLHTWPAPLLCSASAAVVAASSRERGSKNLRIEFPVINVMNDRLLFMHRLSFCCSEEKSRKERQRRRRG